MLSASTISSGPEAGDYLTALPVWSFSQPSHWVSGTYTHDISAGPGMFAFKHRSPNDGSFGFHGINCHWWLTASHAVTPVSTSAYGLL